MTAAWHDRLMARPRSANGPVWYSPKRWMYRGGRPRGLARAMNGLSAWMYARGILTLGVGATLEVRGRSSGRTTTLPVVVAEHEGARYLVSMLGEHAGWVRNVRAAGGEATLLFGTRQAVRLVEVPVAERAPIIKRYLAVAPGARPHIPVDRHAPLADFERVAPDHPVFRIEPRG
jgi:hypothetical protein